MDTTICQVLGCFNKCTDNMGICGEHYGQLSGGYQYALMEEMVACGPNPAYDRLLTKVIDMTQQVGRFKPMR